jgi:hypothetical protein
VLGLATSEAAVRVLNEHGIDHAMNVSRFLGAWDRVRAGWSPAREVDDESRLGPGDLVIVDEASMVSTEHVEAIAAAARRNCAKLVLAGDDRQLDSVGAGGVFDLLIERTRPVVLDEVVRFTNAWEGTASLRLRAGDVPVIAEYDRRGRIQAGPREELLARACRGFVADHLTGRSSLIVTPTNEQAAEVASHIRAELVALGHVDANGVRLHDANRAGVGDLIATRRNDRSLDDGAGGWIANRDTFHVLATRDDGALTVARDLGSDDTGTHRLGTPVRLPADYVAEHVELAYAATAHAAQGRTVDTCTALIEPTMSKQALYVAATRARERTVLAVATDPDPLDALGRQDPDREPTTPEAVLARIIGRPDEPGSATQLLALEIDARESLARLAPEWTDLVTQDAHTRYRHELQHLLGVDRWADVTEDPAIAPLLRAIRVAENDHHLDHAGLTEFLREAIARKELDTADSIASVLHHRITNTPHRDADGRNASFLERTPRLRDPELDAYARAIAVAMDERLRTLGETAATAPPPWTRELGPVPTEPIERAAWTRRAAIIAGYREQHGYGNHTDPIGPAPSRSAIEHRDDWEMAMAALNRPADQLGVASATNGQLLNTVLEWQRTEAGAPPNVDEEMRTTARTADYCDREARHLQALRATGDPAVTAEAVAAFRATEAQARDRVVQLEQAAGQRAAWRSSTEPQRQAAALAKAELEHRISGVTVGSTDSVADLGAGPVDLGASRQPTAIARGTAELDGYENMRTEQPSPGIEI